MVAFSVADFLRLQVVEDTDDFRETVILEDVEKFKGFLYYFTKKFWKGMNGAYHFKTERTVYHEQYKIIDFPNVNHTI